jgi:CRISPR-associated protein Csx14
MSVCIKVDLANPGQFFACCGLQELADRLWRGTEGWFEDGAFWIDAQNPEASLTKLLTAAHDIQLDRSEIESSPKEEDEDVDDADDPVEPLNIVAPFRLRLDWWQDKSLKTWAGSMDARRIFIAMCNAIDPQTSDPFRQSQVVFDAQAPMAAGSANRRKGKPKKREPFYFDGRRGASALPIDVGFSPDSLKLNASAYPVVEAMCLLGLQRCRPRPTQVPRVFEYFAWQVALPTPIVSAAVAGLFGNGRCYRFENIFRTDQRKHKAFTPATHISRSSR